MNRKSEIWLTLDEAAARFRMHRGSLARLLRQGTVYGEKEFIDGRWHWMVYMPSLRRYTDPVVMYEQSRSGPKRWRLVNLHDKDEDNPPQDE